MKICQIKTGILPIPPNKHGAIEKIIWEYHLELEKLNNICDIEYLDDIDVKSGYDIVHIHVANLALMAHERGIPYYFTCHDHHAYLYGKDSYVFKENYEAMKNSIHSFVPAKFLVNYFDLPNLTYLNHGVNNDFFNFKNKHKPTHKLLCVANNGFIHDNTEDRKGFGFAIEAAKKLNLPITIVGPKNNKNFFDVYNSDYSKLNIIYDVDDKQLVEIYNDHTIFLHPSILEAGHPNLTLLEALSCGLPVVGTYEQDNNLDGMIKVDRNVDQITSAITEIINNYKKYQKLSQLTTNKYSWTSVCDKLLNFYKNTMKSQLISTYTSTKISHRDQADIKNNLHVNFNEGAFVEITGQLNKKYDIRFKNDNEVIHQDVISNNMWTKTNKKYLIPYEISITELDSNSTMNYNFDLKNKYVKIINESPSLGDNISWMPVVDKFQKAHDCELHYYTPLKDLYESKYDNIKFFNYNEKSDVKYHATYKIGCFDDKELSPRHYRSENLQRVASTILNLSWDNKYEDLPKLNVKYPARPLNEKYVCISTASTAGCKHWQNKSGWQDTVNYLNSIGYKVVVIQKEPLDYMDNRLLDNVLHPIITDIHDAIKWLNNCEFFIGLASGFSWVSWALKKDVVLISGFSKPTSEFYTPYRVINTDVCNGCWNNINHEFDKSNWNWCPENKNFECTKNITFDMIKTQIKKIIEKK